MTKRSQRLSEREREERRRQDRERLQRAAEELLCSEGWARWVRVRAMFHSYWLRNQMLIAIECYSRGITPTYIAGFRAFLDLNRCVRKDEKAIHILAPIAIKQSDEHGSETAERKVFFRIVPVFDVSMTDPLPGKEPVRLLPPSQPINGDSHQHLIAPLIAHAGGLGYTVELPR